MMLDAGTRRTFSRPAAGTATPRAYQYSWNDDNIATNQFAGVLTAHRGDRFRDGYAGQGNAIVVYNPLDIAREDVVEASVAFPGGMPKAVRVYGPDGKQRQPNSKTESAFLAQAPSVGYTVYHLVPAEKSAAMQLLK